MHQIPVKAMTIGGFPVEGKSRQGGNNFAFLKNKQMKSLGKTNDKYAEGETRGIIRKIRSSLIDLFFYKKVKLYLMELVSAWNI